MVRWGRCSNVLSITGPIPQRVCEMPFTAIDVPADGDYKLVASQGFLFFPSNNSFVVGFQSAGEASAYSVD